MTTDACDLAPARLDRLPDVLRRSWLDQRGVVLEVRLPTGPEGDQVLDAALGRATAAGAAVAVTDGRTGSGLCHLGTGPSPVLSPPTARLVDALQGSPLAQLRLLERLLRCHARHRTVLLVVDRQAELAPSARWILEQLPGLLADAAVTWVWVRHDEG